MTAGFPDRESRVVESDAGSVGPMPTGCDLVGQAVHALSPATIMYQTPITCLNV